MKNKKGVVKLTDKSYIEMMDRIEVIITTIDIHLMAHPTALNDLRVSSLLEKTIENLSDIHALILESSSDKNN